jgi:DNA mismatch repair ATPase MutS
MGGALAAQSVVGLWFRPRVRTAIQSVDDRARDLALVAELAARLEREVFESDDLRALQARLAGSGAPASVEIHRLARLVDLLTSRQNQLFGPLSVLLFWATQLAWAIERWRQRAGRAVPDWLAVLGEFEALAALATFAAEHPEAAYPTLVPGPPRLDAHAVVHPLLPASSAVGNDVALGGEAPHLLMVSGSNMSGKSTFMRAIGVNVVLAQAGAPVCAAALTLTPLVPAGTLRVQDSLQAGRSRFYAEITKLRQIVDLARTDGTGTLFLLDELLAGTNSHDRQQGAEGVLRGLLALGAIGVATTHDLAVAALVDRLGAPATSAHFADRFDEGGLAFDYRLRPGVVATSNALALMRSVGLDV